MKKFYQIYRYDRNHNREILAGGIDKETAEKALEYMNLNPKKVIWNRSTTDLSDPRSGNVEIYEGEYIE